MAGKGEAAHRSLPLCLLARGELSEGLGLSHERLADYVAGHPAGPRGDLLDLPVRRGGSVDLLAFDNEPAVAAQLPRIVRRLRQFCDVVVVDCPSASGPVAGNLAEEADAVLLCGLPTSGSRAEAERWGARCRALHMDQKTLLITNRLRARRPGMLAVPAVVFSAGLADDPRVSLSDQLPVPWALDYESSARKDLDRLATRLLPYLTGV